MLEELDRAPDNLAKLADGALIVIKVFDYSFAHSLGIQPGWILLTIDGRAPDERRLEQARRTGFKELLFCDAALDRVTSLKNAAWPYGVMLAPRPGKRFLQKITNADFDHEGVLMLWAHSIPTAIAALEEPLQRYLSRIAFGPWGRLTGRIAPVADILRHPDYIVLNLLALTKVTNGKIDEAEVVLDAARQSRADAAQASYSRIDIALDYYTQSQILDARGRRADALEAARSAKELASETPEVERWLAELEDRDPIMAAPDSVGKIFPIEYVLEAHDPIGEIVSPIAQVGYREIIDSLRDGEFLLIMVLGDYRSNYYYNLDMERVAELKRAFPDVIKEVHVITHGDYALDARHRRNSERICRDLNLPFVILWDEGAEVVSSITADGLPARFLVDRNGRVLATEGLMDEEGFWLAVKRHRDGI